MAKFYGKIGYAHNVEKQPGVIVEEITERSYYGDIFKNSRRLQSGNQVNDNVNVANEISIVADPYADLNIHAMRYVEFQGSKWKITDVLVESPRLRLTIGGVYNG